MSSNLATQRLLSVLAHRMRTDPPVSDHERWLHSTYRPYIADLVSAHGEIEGQSTPAAAPQDSPAEFVPPQNRADAHRQAVALVLNSPRSTREVLHALVERARAGELATGEHTGTVAAAEELLDALIVSRTLRLPRR
ncbi:hypothetical protein [Nocardia cyriacigeorgica]|uniref:hypothetical protein n=1 Tax=Nocardia cyriacigeorgica TaxID=135487 RepID=UPI0034DB0D02